MWEGIDGIKIFISQQICCVNENFVEIEKPIHGDVVNGWQLDEHTIYP